MRLPWGRRAEVKDSVPRSSSFGRQIDAALDRVDSRLLRVVESTLDRIEADTSQDGAWRLLGGLVPGSSMELPSASRVEIVDLCVRLWMVDGTVAQAESLLASGCFGEGLSRPRAEDAELQAVIDRFWNDPDNRLVLTDVSGLRDTNRCLMCEGERFFTVHTSSADSQVKLADLPSSEITEVICHPENRRRRLVYRREWRPRKYDFVRGKWDVSRDVQVRYYRDLSTPDPLWPQPGDDPEVLEFLSGVPLEPDVAIYHAVTNTMGVRGVPEVYRAYDWARVHAGTVSDMATITKAFAMLAWRKKVRTRSADVVRSAAGQFQSPPPGPGGVFVSNDGVDLEPIRVGTGQVANQSATGRSTFLETIRSFGFGEHWYGDASSGNLAIGRSMELPAIWRIRERQGFFERLIRRVIDFAIERAAQMQDFVYLPDSVRRVYDLDFPPVQPRDEAYLSSLLAALADARDRGLIDAEEASYQAHVAIGTDDVDEAMRRLRVSGGGVREMPESVVLPEEPEE